MRRLFQAIILASLCHPASAAAQSLEDSVATQLRHLLHLSQNAPIQVARNYSPYFGNTVFYRSVIRIIDAPDRYAALIYAHGALVPVQSASDLGSAWQAMKPPTGDAMSLSNACPQLLTLTGVLSENASTVRRKDDLPRHVLTWDAFRKASTRIRAPILNDSGGSEVLTYFVWDGWSLMAVACTLHAGTFGVHIDTLATLPGA